MGSERGRKEQRYLCTRWLNWVINKIVQILLCIYSYCRVVRGFQRPSDEDGEDDDDCLLHAFPSSSLPPLTSECLIGNLRIVITAIMRYDCLAILCYSLI